MDHSDNILDNAALSSVAKKGTKKKPCTEMPEKKKTSLAQAMNSDTYLSNPKSKNGIAVKKKKKNNKVL